MNARISPGSRMRAGPTGSADWRRATRPRGSFLASSREPPFGLLHGFRQPSGPRSAADIPLRIFCMSDLLAGVAEYLHGVPGGGGPCADPVQGMHVGGRILGFVDRKSVV